MTAIASLTAAHPEQERSRPAASLLARHQFRSLEQWLYCSETRRMDLRGIELGEETQGREMLRLLLQAHVDKRGYGDVGPVIEVVRPDRPETTALRRQKRCRGRNILTIFGEVRAERTRYASRRETPTSTRSMNIRNCPTGATATSFSVG